jgi:hypothetical protein
MTRAKRGRLSSLDLLPIEAQPFVRDAFRELGDRKRPAEDIRAELNAHLLGIENAKPISRSAFNRKSLFLAEYGANIAHAREIAATFAERFGEDPNSDVGLLINETIKTIIFDVLMNRAMSDDETSMKLLKEAALTLQRLEMAKQSNVRTRVEIEEKIVTKAADVVEESARAAGLTPERARDIRHKVLGLMPPKPAPLPEGKAA